MDLLGAGDAWVVNGHRVVKKTGLITDTVVVFDQAGEKSGHVDLIGGNEWELTVGTRTFRVIRRKIRTAFSSREQIDLRSASGDLVPPGKAPLLQPIEAPADSQCTLHQEVTAVQACARCGRFSCEVCLGADAVHCSGCFSTRLKTYAREQSAAAWGTPGILFLWGGLLGIVIGIVAAAAAAAYARRTTPERFTAWVPIGIYVASIIAWIVLAQVIRAR